LWACTALVVLSLVASGWLLLGVNSWTATSDVVIAAGLMISTVVAVTAMLLEHSRLGYALAVTVLTHIVVTLALTPISPVWWLVVALMTGTAFLLADPGLGGWIRRRTSAAPVPAEAVALSMILLLLPATTALVTTRASNWLAPLAIADFVLLLAFVRRWPFAMAAIRFGPAVLAGGAFVLPPPGRWLWLAGQVAALVLAWTQSVRLAVRPLIERGSKVLIPPELAPEEIRQMLKDQG
jgi:hypothetical protein